MGTEGAHAGETTPNTAMYRYAITLFNADYFLGRLVARGNSSYPR